MPLRQFTGGLCIWLLLAPFLSGAQQTSSGRLRIIVLEGQGAVNLIPASTAPVVEVRDENDFPVEGAKVTFTLPESGPGAMFANQQRTQTVETNSRGQAGAIGYAINSQTGRFSTRVTASWKGREATILITQTNTTRAADLEPPKRGFAKWKWWIIAGAAAGAATGIILGTRSSPPPPITVGTGPVVIGTPR
ncbi:MAG: hypothetical protein JNL98_03490 [Bryobacterales bacterium]|nr:hypothetical protein [Bryobacterales bacterium]